jgi:hypothetical protein
LHCGLLLRNQLTRFSNWFMYGRLLLPSKLNFSFHNFMSRRILLSNGLA